MTEEEKVAEQRKALDWWYEGFKSGDIAHAYTGFHDDCTWSGVARTSSASPIPASSASSITRPPGYTMYGPAR
ncbi:MAG: hypothetical protein WDN44_13295 [Sphingomonas sp.]